MDNNCADCRHCIENELGHWCFRWHRYVFPKKGEGKNCKDFYLSNYPDGPPWPYKEVK